VATVYRAAALQPDQIKIKMDPGFRRDDDGESSVGMAAKSLSPKRTRQLPGQQRFSPQGDLELRL
jgi:hypothetical protein